jgi:DNA-binding NarL/FixJ family response regulator
MNNAIRVLIVDDHAVLRSSLKLLLEQEGDMQVVGETAQANKGVDEARRLLPDVVVMDLAFSPGEPVSVSAAANATKQIRQACPATKIVVLTGMEVPQFYLEMREAGALGYVLKSSIDPTDIVKAIRAAANGKGYMSPSLGPAVMELRERAGGNAPTPREWVILGLLCEGKTTKEISSTLNIAAATVNNHVREIMNKT